MRFVRSLAAAYLAICMVGCSTQLTIKAYPGPNLPASQIAVIRGKRFGFFERMATSEYEGVYIIGVDGVDLDIKILRSERIVRADVAPGAHTVEFGFRDSYAKSTTSAKLAFVAEAGKTYVLHAAPMGTLGEQIAAAFAKHGRWQGWITEGEKGRVVAGAGIE